MTTNASMNTYVQVGKKEDVSDVITMISPTATPFLTLIGSEPCDNTLYQWQEDSLSAPASNAAVEGADAPAAAMSATVMRQNYTQIFTKTVSASGSTDAMKTYGRGRELAYQLALKGKEIKRDLEYALVGTAQSAAVGSATVARTFAGAQAQIDSSVTTSASTAALTETLVLGVSQKVYTAGGEPTTLLIKPADSLIVASFAAATGRTRYLDGGAKKVVNVVDVYVSPFGDLKVVLDRYIATADALMIDPSMWKLRVFRNWQTIDLAKTGDATKKQLVGEFGLTHRNWAADGRISDLT